MEQMIENKVGLQSLMEDKIGYGNGQKKLLFSVYLLLFSQGSESIVLGMLIPQLGGQWGIGNYEKSLLITLVYVGVSVGSYLQAYSDKYGRYPFLLLDAIITSVFGLASAFCSNFNTFLFTRFFYGIGIGIALPLTATYIIENVPMSYRGSILAFSRIYWALGCVFASVLGWIFMSRGHWRVTLFILSLPNIYCCYDIYKNGKESIRYLWSNGQKLKLKSLLDHLAVENNRQLIPYNQIIELVKNRQAQGQKQRIKFRELLNQKYRKQTIILCYLWASGGFTFYAVVLIIPTILARHTEFSINFTYLFLIFMSVIEVFSFFLSKVMMDHPSLGRKKSIYYGTMIICFLTTSILIFGESSKAFLVLVFAGVKVFSTTSFNILNPYSTEIYETQLRSQAMAIFSLFARVATAIMGMVGISSLDWFGGLGLYLILAILSGLSCFSVNKMPYCTLGRQLDI